MTALIDMPTPVKKVQTKISQFFVVLEKFTCAYLFQIALELIRLPIQIALHSVQLPLYTLPKIESWDNAFKSFHWLSHRGL